MYRVAICLHGLVGNITGKSYKNESGAAAVLKIAGEHWYDHIVKPQENTQVDFFAHSWSVDIHDKIEKVFKPKVIYTEPERTFIIPDHVKAVHHCKTTGKSVPDPQRAQAHYHRWFSCKQSVAYKKQYEEKHDFKYDAVMVARYDLAWKKTIFFKDHDQKYLWISKWWRPSVGSPVSPTVKIKDLWFFSSSKNIDDFSTMYDHLDDYTKKENSGRHKLMGISSHYLMPYHMMKLNLTPQHVLLAKNNHRDSDFPVVRHEYFDAKI